MAPFEEKVLAYLDGSLPAAEREEVMRAVSISPDRRALLDAHLRMNDLFTIVQKPISAPLQLQRDLAKQVPVLAAKLPYLATDPRRRSAAAFGFFGRMASGPGSIRASTIGALLLAIGLVSVGVWFIVNQSQKNNIGPTLSSADAVATNGAPGMGAPTAAASNTSAGSSGNGGASFIGSGGSGARGGTNNATHGNSSSLADGGVSGSHGVFVGDTLSSSSRHHARNRALVLTPESNSTHSTKLASLSTSNSAAKTLSASNRSSTTSEVAKNRAIADNAVANASINDISVGNVVSGAQSKSLSKAKSSTQDVPAGSSSASALDRSIASTTNSTNGIRSQSVSNADRDTKSSTSVPPAATRANPKDEPPVNISTITLADARVAKLQEHHSMVLYNRQEEEKNYVPVHVFAVPTYRLISPNSPALSSYVVDNKIGITTGFASASGFEAGVDYEINPWFLVGIHGGQTAFLQLQPQPRSETVPGYEHLTQQISDTKIASLQAPWVGASLGYQFNPLSETWSFGATLSGGEAFWSGSTAPIAMLEATSDCALSNGFSVRGGVSFDVSWTPKYTVSTTSSTGTLGILQGGPDLSTLRSTAISVSLGLVFHP